MYIIKPFEKANIPFVYELMSELSNLSSLHTATIPLEEWQKSFAESKDTYEENFIVYKNDIPCAWLKLNGLRNKDVAWISMLVVSNEFKHQGVGQSAIEFAIGYLKQRGCKQIKLQTTEDNLPAIKLYSKCGFTVISKNSEKIIMCKEV